MKIKIDKNKLHKYINYKSIEYRDGKAYDVFYLDDLLDDYDILKSKNKELNTELSFYKGKR